MDASSSSAATAGWTDRLPTLAGERVRLRWLETGDVPALYSIFSDPRNERSIALLLKKGFRREGLLRERYRVNGEIQDTVMLGLLRLEWPPPVRV